MKNGVTGSPFSGSPIRKFLFLIKCLISFKVAFNQAFLTYVRNMIASAKFLSHGTKCDTSDPDYSRVGKTLFSWLTTDLKTLCKPLSILFSESSAPFHSFCVCLIRSHIFNLGSLVLSSICIWFPYQMYLREFALFDPWSDSLSVDDSSIESKI